MPNRQPFDLEVGTEHPQPKLRDRIAPKANRVGTPASRWTKSAINDGRGLAPRPPFAILRAQPTQERKSMAKCPSCNTQITAVNGEHVTVYSGMTQWNGIAYVCRSCNTLLNVEIDPISLKADIVAEVADRVRRMLGR